MQRTISIIMPAYNEGEHIYKNIRMTREVMHEAGMPAEIVVVDDGSDDNTLEEIRRAAGDFDNVVVARNPYNMGKGMALRTGFDYSSGEIVVFLDADLDLHPSQIQILIHVLEKTPYDVVVTSKHHPESRLDYPWFRKIASWVYYMLIKALFGLPVRDTQTGLKVFRREVLLNVFHRLLVKKFAYDVELLATAVRFGYRVHEIPVVLEFKRDLSWGRIRTGDVISIFIDTLAIFYRLRILRYYDAERPPMPREERNVLIVIRGCPPPDDVIERLSVDSNTRIACISDNATIAEHEILHFQSDKQLEIWIKSNNNLFEIIGFLGAGYLPIGSWVKNAVRNFEDPEVLAVCGPLIPGPVTSHRGKAAGLLFSSFITAGPDNYLYSLRPLKPVRKGLVDNMFLRADYFEKHDMEKGDLTVDKGFIYDTTPRNTCLRYDPDVAVSKPVPSLFLPYLNMVGHDAFVKGFNFFALKYRPGQWWGLIPPIFLLIVFAGWVVLPVPVYMGFIAISLSVVVITGLFCFDMLTAPLFMIGIILENLVRGCAFPAGIFARIIKKRGKIVFKTFN